MKPVFFILSLLVNLLFVVIVVVTLHDDLATLPFIFLIEILIAIGMIKNQPEVHTRQEMGWGLLYGTVTSIVLLVIILFSLLSNWTC